MLERPGKLVRALRPVEIGGVRLAASLCQEGVRAGLISRKPAQKATGEAWMASVGT